MAWFLRWIQRDQQSQTSFGDLTTRGLSSERGVEFRTPTKKSNKHRIVIPRLGEREALPQQYRNNRIRTTKYTLLNFLPKNLFEQFHR